MLETAIEAASEAGKLLRRNFGSTLQVNLATHHDIKLEIDEQSQQVITKVILADFPDHCILGEEAVTGNPNADVRWVVDPLDGTVNYFYGIPHYAVSVAAQEHKGGDQWETVAGVVVLLGCAHSGVVNTLERVAEITNRREIHAIAGGMHLRSASEDRLRNTADALEAFGISTIAPSHCTGANALAFFGPRFGKRLRECTVGCSLVFPLPADEGGQDAA